MIINRSRYLVEIDYYTEREITGFDTLEEAEAFMEEMESLDPKLIKCW